MRITGLLLFAALGLHPTTANAYSHGWIGACGAQASSLPVDANGWTIFSQPTASGAKIYYISTNDGSDSNNGTSVTTPWQTIAKAVTQATTDNGKDDWFLLKKGDVFSDQEFSPNVGAAYSGLNCTHLRWNGQLGAMAETTSTSSTTNLPMGSSPPAWIISGMYVRDATTASAIPPNTTITVSGSTITMSNSGSSIGSGDQIQFWNPNYADIALATFSGSTGTVVPVCGTSPTAPSDGEFEFIADCDMTAAAFTAYGSGAPGWCNVADWSTSTGVNPVGSQQFWFNAVPFDTAVPAPASVPNIVGGWILRRDINPVSNDNVPAFMSEAA